MGNGANRVVSRNSIIYRHPCAVLDPIILTPMVHPIVCTEFVGGEWVTEWLEKDACSACMRTFKRTPAFEKICQECEL